MLTTVTLTLLEGLLTTLELFALTLLLALPLGLVISFGSMSAFAPLRYLMKTIVWVIRGTPLMIQILIIFYGPGLLFGPGSRLRWCPSPSITPAISPKSTGAAFSRCPRDSMRRDRFWV